MPTFRFNGKYRRSRGERHSYQYQAAWTDTGGEHVTWVATITRDGHLCGTPNGVIAVLSAPRILRAVRTRVEEAIEALSGMVE